MLQCPNRRTFLLAALTAPFALALGARASDNASALFETLEGTAGGRLGVCAWNTADGRRILYRAEERFPFCSTFKVILAGAILAHSARVDGFLQRQVHYTKNDLVTYSPVTEKHLTDGLTVAELCAAALQYSDNTASNLLMKLLGGPEAVTTFARSIGDRDFRLDRWETALNSALPGDPRDTTSPVAMAQSLHALALGDSLAVAQREQLQAWLRGNTTGAKRIRAGVPTDWQVGDKTGTGDYGTTNDVAVIWPSAGGPIVLAVYYTQLAADAKPRDDVIAAATRIVVDSLR
ncbi:class A beta-lactamase [Pseudomonas akapageensis]|uniref:class A beta-lactamase n=1 Tax=Pseudomonas akapageensis TaxID=2609961 RepID=UPI00140CAC78|nr:class A beta-lactamase [Pseudomonas akapageensis]